MWWWVLWFGCGPDAGRWTPIDDVVAWPDEAGAPIPVPAALDLPWLADVSGYGQRGLPAGRSTSGTFGVGSGVTFGVVGLDKPWNTLTGGIGPTYQADDAFFGDASLRVLRDGVPLDSDEEAVQRSRGTAIVRTWARLGDVTLTTTDHTVPGAPWIGRHLTVRNDGPPASDLAVRLTLARRASEPAPVDARGLRQDRGDQQLLIHCPDAPVALTDRTLTLTVPHLDTGEEASFRCFHQVSSDGTFEDDPAPDARASLEAARAAAGALLDRAVHLDVPDDKVADLVEGMLLTEWVQTSASGVVSPVHRYGGGWLRDNEGPVRLYLAAGLHEEARAVLDGTYRISATRRAITNAFPLDVDLSGFTDPEDGDAWFAEGGFMGGRNPVEAPSYLPVLTALYVARSGDRTVLDGARLDWLEACVRRQEVTPEGLMRFSGDETFGIWLGVATGVGTPATSAWSANSGFWYVAASEALDALGADPDATARAGLVRAATDATYDLGDVYSPLRAFDAAAAYPDAFEDVSTMPLWTGYLDADDPRARPMVDALVARFQQPDGTFAGSDTSAITGMVPGFFLQNLAVVHHPEGGRAFDALDRIATPSGHFEEGHSPDHLPLSVAHQAADSGLDAAARFRPWEGGDVVAALLTWMIGAAGDAERGTLSLAPHVPAGWPGFSATNLRLGDDRYEVDVAAYVEGRAVTIRRVAGRGAWSVRVDLTGDAPFSGVWHDGVRVGEGDVVRVEADLGPGEALTLLGRY